MVPTLAHMLQIKSLFFKSGNAAEGTERAGDRKSNKEPNWAQGH